MEVLVVDGLSDDGTREIVATEADHDPRVRLLDNPKRIIPAGMNIGISAATAEIILKADAHSTYARDYVRKSVEHLLESGADNVGGVLVTKPSQPTTIGRAIAIALAHPFGSGRSRFRIRKGGEPEPAETVAFGCYRADVFARIGLFDERLTRSSDMELNSRLLRAGGRILLAPDIVATYYARSGLIDFIARNYVDGYWALYPLRFGSRGIRLRHAVPAVCLSGGVVTAILGLFHLWMLVTLAAVVGLYVALAIIVAVRLAKLERSALVGVLLPVVFLARHAPYAIGSVVGLLRAIASRDFLRLTLSREASKSPHFAKSR